MIKSMVILSVLVLAGCSSNQSHRPMPVKITDSKACPESSEMSDSFINCYISTTTNDGLTLQGNIATNADVGEWVTVECRSANRGGTCYAYPVTQ